MASKLSPRKGLVHLYTPRLTAFEHAPNSLQSSNIQDPQNIILFIGGLFDGLMTVPYPSIISDVFPNSTSHAASWSVGEVHLSSSYTGWGTSSLARDAKELAKCVSYFRTIKSGKIVLMGHSTGCQDVMEYLTGPGHENRPPIDGAIIQAAVSDREAIIKELGPDLYRSSCERAKAMVAEGHGDEIIPSYETKNVFPCPITARRWLSLASPDHDGDDDYFSSDLTDEQLMKTFGQLPARTPLCVILSGNDEYMPKTIDKERLLKRWTEIARRGKGYIDGNSGVVEGATHNLSGNPKEVVAALVERVLGFLDNLPGVQANL